MVHCSSNNRCRYGICFNILTMTNEEIKTIQEDLTTRFSLSKEIKVRIIDNGCVMVCKLDEQTLKYIKCFDEIKPYLRRMSDITIEEAKYLNSLKVEDGNLVDYAERFKNFCMGRNLDYNRLIEKDLAFIAPKDMYSLEKIEL